MRRKHGQPRRILSCPTPMRRSPFTKAMSECRESRSPRRDSAARLNIVGGKIMMTSFVRNTLVVLPLGLIFSGCAGPQQTVSSNHRPSQPPIHVVAPLGLTMIADHNDGRPVRPSSDSVATQPRHDITLEQLSEHIRNGTAVVMDARSPEQFANGHLRGAMNVPAGQIASLMPTVEQTVGADQLIIIYCYGPACESGDMVYEYLASHGFTNMRVYSPGWLALASAKNLQ